MKKISIGIIFILAILYQGLVLTAGNSPAFQGRGQRGHGQRHGQPELRTSLPEGIVLQSIDGKSWDKDSLEGKIVILEFWATWCAPCLQKIPQLKKIHETYKDRDVLILGINLDNTDRRTIRRWLQRNSNRMGWPQLLNNNGFGGELPQYFNIDEVPTNLVFNRQGQLVGRGMSPPEIINKVENLLKQTSNSTQRSGSSSND